MLYVPEDIPTTLQVTLCTHVLICSFHPEIQPREIKYITLDDGRKLCLECLNSSIMDTPECQHLYMDIQEFFEGLNMKVEQQIPSLLVERQALNEALEAEKNVSDTKYLFGVHNTSHTPKLMPFYFALFKGHHLPETRGLCLSEEQIVRTVSSLYIDALCCMGKLLRYACTE